MSDTADKCPVDHEARAKWLSTQSLISSPAPSATTKTCDSSTLDQTPSSKPTTSAEPSSSNLRKDREISSIPRAADAPAISNSEHHAPSSSSSAPANWIYPSEEMFFNAMKRKAYDPQAADMRTVVPIHNAVNERAWKEIKEWEAGRGAEKCGGPKLASFSGDSKKMTPKARLLTVLGYTAPFDRHDWVVDRCGKKVEYVIDFYAGKADPLKPGMPSFYLDVRPKLSFEGAIMRLQRWMKGS